MRIITEPSVYLLGRMQLDRVELQTFLHDIDASEWTTAGDVDGDILVEVGGRTCYQSWGKGRSHRDHVENLIESGHLSCREHSVYTVLITGVSRSLTHELIRHRHLSPSQLSQRYVDESVAEYVCPDIVWADPELRELWVETIQRTHTAYVTLTEKLNAKLSHTRGPCNNPNCDKGNQADQLRQKTWVACPTCKGVHADAFYAAPLERFLNLDKYGTADATTRRKAARQAARSVLPNACETKIQMTGNVRAWRELLVKRGSRHAEPEIRKLANHILELLHGESPLLFGDFTRSRLPDGTDELTLPPSED